MPSFRLNWMGYFQPTPRNSWTHERILVKSFQPSTHLAADRHRRETAQDRIGRAGAGGHVPHAGCWHVVDQNRRAAQGNRATHVRHQHGDHRANMQIEQARCGKPANQHIRRADSDDPPMSCRITQPGRWLAHRVRVLSLSWEQTQLIMTTPPLTSVMALPFTLTCAALTSAIPPPSMPI